MYKEPLVDSSLYAILKLTEVTQDEAKQREQGKEGEKAEEERGYHRSYKDKLTAQKGEGQEESEEGGT
jgi:hypothetical protein